MRKYLLIIMLVLLCGCGSLAMLAQESGNITPIEIRQNSTSVGDILDDFVPEPYRFPSSIALGYIIALLRRVYKKHKGSKNA